MSHDMSTDGIFFYTRSKLEVGTEIEFTATLPLENLSLPEIQVRSNGKVVRFEELNPGLSGVRYKRHHMNFWLETSRREYLGRGRAEKIREKGDLSRPRDSSPLLRNPMPLGVESRYGPCSLLRHQL